MAIEEYVFRPSPEGEEESGFERSLRPARFEDFLGQRRVVENLKIAIAAAQARGEILDHVLFSGPPGLGKTTLSYLTASALGTDLHAASGPSLQRGKDIAGLLTELERGDILFIDEIHRMSIETEEYLYAAMEDYRLDLVVDRGAEARSYRFVLQPFTLIGATTREGLLSAPLRSRFGIHEKLELYPPEDLVEIVRRSARILGCAIEEAAAEVLARRSRGTPRYANRFLRRVRDLAQYRTGWTPEAGRRLRITEEHVREGLERLGVDDHGLDRIDRKILEVLLAQDEPVGVKTLAISVGEEERTIEDVYEPYLIQQGMMVKTPRGRRPGALAFELFRRGEPGSRPVQGRLPL